MSILSNKAVEAEAPNKVALGTGAAFSRNETMPPLVRRQIDMIAQAASRWREDRLDAGASDEPASPPRSLLSDKLKAPVMIRSLVALAVVAVFGAEPTRRLLATTSAEATVNAQIISIRAPIDGEISILTHPFEIGDAFQFEQEIATVHNPRADQTPLNKLERDQIQMSATIQAYEEKMRILAARRSQVQAQQTRFSDARTRQVEQKVAEIGAQIAAAKAENVSAATALERAKYLFARRDVSAAEVEKSERNQRVAAANLTALESRNQGAAVELSALRNGVFVGDSYNDTPQSAQRGLDLDLEMAELEARLAGMRAASGSLLAEIESERRHYDEISRAVLRSPSVGRIWEVIASPGESVRAGQEIVRLLDCHATIVTASVGEAAYQKLRFGEAASFQPRDGGPSLHGWIVGLNGRAASISNNAIQQSALAKEPYHVTVKLPSLAQAGDCVVGRAGLVTFESGEGAAAADLGLRPGS